VQVEQKPWSQFQQVTLVISKLPAVVTKLWQCGKLHVLEASVEKGEICEKESENAVLQRVGRQARAQECHSRRRRGKVGTLKKHKGSTGELSMPYAPPGADSVLEVSAEWGGNMCGRVRERGVFSVWDDRRERKNASRRRRGKVGTLKKHKGSTGGKCQCRRGAVNAVRTTEIGRCVATHRLQRSLSRSENALRSVSRECKNASRRSKKGTKKGTKIFF
jgi:hypothetical protein